MMHVRRAEMLPIECIVRGYLAGSAWKEYRADGTVHGARVRPGCRSRSGSTRRCSPRRRRRRAARTTRTSRSTTPSRSIGPDVAEQRARDQPRRVRRRCGSGRGGRHHRRRHQARARIRRWRARARATRCSRPTRRGSGPPTSGSRASRLRRSTSSRSATGSSSRVGTSARRPRRCPPEVVDGEPRAVRRGLRAHHRLRLRRLARSPCRAVTQ